MSDAAGERRIVSVLVTDIIESTAIAERLGPERSKFLFDEIGEACPYVHRGDELAPLLERGRSVTDPDERWRLYREADRLLVADHAVIVPLAYTTYVQLHRPWVHGVSVSPLLETTVDQYVVRRDQRP